MKPTIIIEVKNDEEWPRIDEEGNTIGSYVEWRWNDQSIEDGYEGDSIWEDEANRVCKRMTDGGLGLFRVGEEIEEVLKDPIARAMALRRHKKHPPTKEFMQKIAQKKRKRVAKKYDTHKRHVRRQDACRNQKSTRRS